MTKHIKNSFVISFIFLIFSIIFLSIFFNKISRDNLSEQIQHRQQLAVRSGARSIESFLSSVGKSLVIVSNDPAQKNLDQFIDLWSESNVTGIIYVNSDGLVTRISNLAKTNDIGVDISERDYFKWAKSAKRGDFFVFPPRVSQIGASKGKYTLPIAVPIFNSLNKFEGLVSASVLLSNVNESYLRGLEILDSSKIYLVTSDGEIIYSEQSEIAGKNFRDIFSTDFLGKEKVFEILSSELKSEAETKVKIALPNEKAHLN